MKQRLDTLLVELNLCSSRVLAQRLIQSGEVIVNQQVIDKPGTEVDISAQINIKERSPPAGWNIVTRFLSNFRKSRCSHKKYQKQLDFSGKIQEITLFSGIIICFHEETFRHNQLE